MMAALRGTKLYAEGEYEGSLKDFGLDQPWLFTVYFTDGSSKTLKAGRQTPTGSGYYVMNEESGAIYVVPNTYGQRLRLTQSTVTEGALVNFVDADMVNSIEIRKKGQLFMAMTAELYRASDSSVSREWKVTAPVKLAGNSPEIDSLVTAVNEMAIADTVGDGEGEFEKYGLDLPAAEYDFRDSQGIEYSLAIGDKTEDGLYYYCSVGTSTTVYRVYASNVKFIDNTVLFYSYPYAFFENYTGLSWIRMDLFGSLNEVHTLSFKFNEDGSETIALDDVEAKDKDQAFAAKGITTYCYAIQLDGILPEEPKDEVGELIARIIYNRADGTFSIVEAKAWDDARCLLYRDGEYFGGWCETWRIFSETDHQGLAGTIHAYQKYGIVD